MNNAAKSEINFWFGKKSLKYVDSIYEIHSLQRVANLAQSTLPRQAWMQSHVTYHDTLETFYLYIHAARGQKN